ncbi:hypothetical protein IPH19_01210 [Candidatus Uhrbacteria bacterium]|nr:MAG: hypothetical protein IPH19_01210 [Candidatus Uhrbacteria bacterium]
MKQLQRLFAATSMIALLGAGCGAAPSSPTGTSPTPTPSRPVAGRCLNAYYPLDAGSSIAYRSVNGGTEVPFKISVIEHDANGIKLEYDMTVRGRNAKITNELECVGGVVKGKGYFDFASAFLGFDVSYEVLEMSGEILPADMRVGKEWVNTSKVKITTTDTGPIGSMMNGRISSTKITNKVTAEESVTVPAGTFTALKVEQTIQVESTIAGRPFNTTSNSTAWYVKDVGLVKSVSGTGANAFLLEAETIED